MMKRALSSAVGGIALLVMAGGIAAQEIEVSGNVAITSDYAFRGISQTLEEPAVQGGLDILAPLGLYLGAWGSSVNFGEDLGGGARAQMELDIYGGIAPSFAGFDLDLGVLYYAYPGAASTRSYDFVEVYAGVGRELGPLSLGLNGAYSPDFFAGSGKAFFGSISASASVPGTPFGLDGSLGMQTIDDEGAFGAPDYLLWSAGVSTELYGTGIGAAITGTDLDEGDCFGGSELCKVRVILTLSRAL